MTMTYNSLILEVQAYLERADASTVSNIPNFISNAEYRISKDLDGNLGLVQYVANTFTVANGVIAKPARWRRTLTFRFGSGVGFNKNNQLYNRVYDFCNNYWPDRTVLAPPKFYADYGYYNWLVVPTPDIAYPYEIGYIELVEPLSLANQTNWLTNYAPTALLFGTLLEATPFLKDDERIPTWTANYQDSISGLKQQDSGRYTDRVSDRESD